MAIARDRAILLKRYPYGESSLVVHVCTRGHGRVHLMAKGAYRTTSRYYAVLDFLDTLELEWAHSPARDLSNLHAGSILERRRRIPEDRARWFAASVMLELADIAARPQHSDPELYDLLEDGLGGLEDLRERASPERCLCAFELRFLGVLGLTPSLERCAACGGEAAPIAPLRAAFSAGAGGRLCSACAREARASGRRVGTLPVRTLDDAGALLASGPRNPTELPADRVLRVRDFAGRFLDYHLEARPRTHRAFLSVRDRNAKGAIAEAG